MAKRLALRGDAVSRWEYVATWEPYCDNPITLSLHATQYDIERPKPMSSHFKVPCRKCAKCLQFRQMKWRERALSEIAAAKRSWFVTLTFSPLHLAGIMQEARTLKGRDMAEKVDRAAYRHVQRFFKRLRKAMPESRFRYIATFEEGEKTGRAHYHLLLHEQGPKPLTKRLIERQWRSNVHCRLVDTEQDAMGKASYITKYATKSLTVRVRSSTRYGSLPSKGESIDAPPPRK